jgi:squalene cyclase
MRSLQLYAPASERAAYDEAVRRAAVWLAKADPHSTEERAFQLLAFGWSKAPEGRIEKAARALIAEQRADGGWSQLPGLTSDAYATGQALTSLVDSGAMTVADAAYRRGVSYLLSTQLADGSWFVRSRAIPIQPFFESGFPHGRDQFISAAATNWATIALSMAIAH